MSFSKFSSFCLAFFGLLSWALAGSISQSAAFPVVNSAVTLTVSADLLGNPIFLDGPLGTSQLTPNAQGQALWTPSRYGKYTLTCGSVTQTLWVTTRPMKFHWWNCTTAQKNVTEVMQRDAAWQARGVTRVDWTGGDYLSDPKNGGYTTAQQWYDNWTYAYSTDGMALDEMWCDNVARTNAMLQAISMVRQARGPAYSINVWSAGFGSGFAAGAANFKTNNVTVLIEDYYGGWSSHKSRWDAVRSYGLQNQAISGIWPGTTNLTTEAQIRADVAFVRLAEPNANGIAMFAPDPKTYTPNDMATLLDDCDRAIEDYYLKPLIHLSVNSSSQLIVWNLGNEDAVGFSVQLLDSSGGVVQTTDLSALVANGKQTLAIPAAAVNAKVINPPNTANLYTGNSQYPNGLFRLLIPGRYTFTNASGNNLWSGASNWDPSGPPPGNIDSGNYAYFTNGGTNVTAIAGETSIGSVQFTNAGWTINGNATSQYFYTYGIQSAGAGTNTINTGISSRSVVPASFTVGSGNTLVMNGLIGAGGGDRNAGGLNKNGAGTLTITNANTYTGATNIDAGTLQVGDGTNGHDGSIAGASIVNNSVLSYNLFSAKTYTGVISGPGTLTKSGAGTLTFSGANSYSGGSTVSAGTLKLDLSARTGQVTLNNFTVAAAGTLELFNTNTATSNLVANSAFSGAGTINKTGAGNLALWLGSSIAGFSGTINVNAGTLAVNNLGASATTAGATVNIASGTTFDNRLNSALVIDKLTGSGTLNHSATDTVNVTIGSNNGSSTFAGTITSTGGASFLTLTKTGTGTLTLTNTSSYSGLTTINGGTLNVTGSILSSSVKVNDGGSLTGGGTTGALTVASGGTVAPGVGGVGSLNLNNKAVSLSGTTSLVINAATGAISAGIVNASGVTYGGALKVTNLGGTFTAGQSFTLFSAASYSGAFATIRLPALPAGLYWDTSTLTSNGKISVTTTNTQVFTSVGVAPAVTNLGSGATQQLSAFAIDQYGNPMPSGLVFTWSLAGSGTLDSSGFYTALYTPGTATATATTGAYTATASITVTNAAPTVTTVATASPAPVSGLITSLSVLGADSDGGGEQSLIYSWAATSIPAGATAPVFSQNGTNAAKNTTVTFSSAGAYTFQCTMTDLGGVSVTSSVNVTVYQTPLNVTVSPATATLPSGATVQLAVDPINDQFGSPISNSAFTWSVVSGIGSVSSGGLYTAPLGSAGSATVQASVGGVNGTASITITPVVNGVWINPAGGSWLTSTNWQGNGVPFGDGVTADFSTLTLTGNATVTLDGAKTIGTLIFGDTAPYDWVLNAGSGGSLTLSATGATPIIQVNNQKATIGAVITGSQGFEKRGAGKLALSGANTYSGDTAINAGTLTLGASNVLPDTSFVTIAAGALLDMNGKADATPYLNGAGNVTNNGGLTLDLGGASSRTFSGTLSGSTSSLTIRGANGGTGTQIFNLANPATVSALTLSGTGAAALELAGGNLAATGSLKMQNTAGSSLLNLSGGSLTVAGTDFLIGNSGWDAEFRQTAGSFSHTGTFVGIANFGGTSVLNLSGGSFTTAVTIALGVRGNASLNISGSAAVDAPSVRCFWADGTTPAGKTATINLNGGTLTTGQIFQNSSQSTSLVNFNGGTLRARAGSTGFIGVTTARVKSGGAIIDTNSFDLTIDQALLEDPASTGGGLTKNNAGTLTLAGVNTYSGPTAVNAGKLNVLGSIASSSVIVNSGASLTGSGTTGAVVVSAGATITPGVNGAGLLKLNNKTLSLAGTANLTVNASTGATGGGIVNVSAVTYGGLLKVTNLGGTFTAGQTFTLFSATTYSGSFSSIGLPALTAGLYWDISTLGADGKLRVSTANTQVVTSVDVAPALVNLDSGAPLQFSATASDQYGNPMQSPDFIWNLTGSGTLDSSGLYTASYTSGTATVTVSAGAFSKGADVTVTNAAPTLATAAIASPATVTGTTTALSVLGADTDGGGEQNLSYTWAATSIPDGATAPVILPNATNGSKNTTATFTSAGAYTFNCTITDLGGASITSSTTVTVNLTAAMVTVTPATASLPSGASLQLTAGVVDQFGRPLGESSFDWSVVAGPGSVSAEGLYTAPVGTAGNATVQASTGGVGGTALITVIPVTTGVWINPAGGSWLTSANWQGGGIPSGDGVTADFSTLTLTTDATVTLDGARTIGSLIFGDTASYGWILNAGSEGPLTLSATAATPLIQVNNQKATIAAVIAGSRGFEKTGAGTLTLAGANTYSGCTTISAGTLELGAANVLPEASLVTIAAGALLDMNGKAAITPYLSGAGNVANNGGLTLDLGGANSRTFSGSIGGSTSSLTIRAANGGTGVQILNLAEASTVSALSLGGTGAAALQLAGGDLAVSGCLKMDNTAGGALLTLSGGSLAVAGTDFVMGEAGGDAELRQSGGAFSHSGSYAGIANRGGTSVLNLSGGSFTTSAPLVLGVRGNASLYLSGSAAVEVPDLRCFWADGTTPDGTTATVNLNGGTLTTARIFQASTRSTSTVNFNGGTLRARAGNGGFLNVTTALVQSGGAVIDTNHFDLTIGQALLEDPASPGGGLIKNNAGTLTLAGVNTYTGPTAVNAGVLNVSGSISNSSVTINSGGSLTGTGTTGAVVVSAGGMIAPGLNGAGSLNLNNKALSLSGAAAMTINASTGSSIQGISTVTYGGTLTVTNAAGTPAAGNTFTLFSAGSYAGAFSSVSLPALPNTLTWDVSNLGVNGTISVAQTSWGQWLSQNFTPSQLADPAFSGDSATPNGDRTSNLLKYALGVSPWAGRPLPVIEDIETVGGSSFLRLTVNKNPAATDVTYSVEVSGDFNNWLSTGAVVEINTASALVVRDSVAIGSAPRRFIRLRVTR